MFSGFILACLVSDPTKCNTYSSNILFGTEAECWAYHEEELGKFLINNQHLDLKDTACFEWNYSFPPNL